MGVNVAQTTLSALQTQFKFKRSDYALQYLGTFIPRDLTRTFELNFLPLLTRT